MITLPLSRYRICLLALCLLLLNACADPAHETLRFGLQAMPVTLDPRYATDAAAARINRLLYDQLVDFDEQFKPVPSLASWQRLEPRHFRFRLRGGDHRFHNGMPLTAADIKATYDSVLDPDNGSPHRAALSHIKRIVVHDPSTVDFYLSEADPLFPGKLGMGILPARLIEQGHPFERRPVGSGPMAFVAWPGEGRLRLERRRDSQVIEFVRIQDDTVRVLKLLRGEIDMLQNDLPFEIVDYLEQRRDIQVQRSEGTNFTYLGFNLRDPVMSDIRVRKAIAHALDRKAIVKHVFAGAARPANALLPPYHWAGNAQLQPYEYAPGKARALLQEAGYNDANPAHIVYKTSSDSFRIRLATIIQSQLEQAGMEVEIRSYDWGTFYGDIKAGRFQMYSLSWVGIKTPDIFNTIFHSQSIPPRGANRGRFSSVAADRLIEQAEAAAKLGEQARYYRQLQRLLLEQLPYVPLWYEDHVFAARNYIQGFSVARDGNYDALVHVQPSNTAHSAN